MSVLSYMKSPNSFPSRVKESERVNAMPLPNAIRRRPLPTNLQFSGFVTVGEPPEAGARAVQLRRANGEVVATARSDNTGVFRFTEWFPKLDDYVFGVVGENYVDRSYPVDTPIGVVWRGNPDVNSSDE